MLHQDSIGISQGIQLEHEGAKFLSLLLARESVDMRDVLTAFHMMQEKVIVLLEKALIMLDKEGRCPAIDVDMIIGADDYWKKATSKLLAESKENSFAMLTTFWWLHTFHDKTAQFYQQSSQNTNDSRCRLFCQSMSELKKIKKRRVEMCMSPVINRIWEDIGYSPFLLGK